MLEETLRKALRFAFGSGANISAANPLPVTAIAAVVEHGIATGGTNVTLIDTAKDWAVNMWEDAYAEVTIAGVEYHRMITANTNDTLTFNALPALVVVVAGDEYNITRETNPLIPQARAEIHNVAVVAGVDILAAALGPNNAPCLFRVTVGFNVAGVLSVTITRAGNTQTLDLNHGVVLTAGCLFMYDLLVSAGDTINYQYGVNATCQILRLQEINAGTQ